MVKRIVAAVFAAAVVLVPLSAPASAADKPASSKVVKGIDWDAPGKGASTFQTLRIDWD